MEAEATNFFLIDDDSNQLGVADHLNGVDSVRLGAMRKAAVVLTVHVDLEAVLLVDNFDVVDVRLFEGELALALLTTPSAAELRVTDHFLFLESRIQVKRHVAVGLL